ncbi:MAG TPA: hypothetical protein VJR89_18050 [Polyangiales bacterium]|nr:hypothetical protein [Polyangiales bacterium]
MSGFVVLLAACGRVPDETPVVAEPAPPAAIKPEQPAPAEPAKQPAPDPILTARESVPVSEHQDVPVPGELRIAMEELADALRAGDAAAVLAKFPRGGGFRYVDTQRAKPVERVLGYARLERDLNAKQGLHPILFGPKGVAQYVSGERAMPWFATASDEFSPRDADRKKVWVRFRLEGDAWKVDALGYPAALRGP